MNFNQILFLSLVEQLRATALIEPGQQQAHCGRPYPRAIIYAALSGQMFAGTNAYIVNRRAIGRLVEAMEAEIARGLTRPVDVFYLDQFRPGGLQAYCTVPFLTSVPPPDIAPSTIGEPPKAIDLVSYLMRSHFFVDRDLDAIRRLTASLNEGFETPDYIEPMVELSRFLFSDRFALAR